MEFDDFWLIRVDKEELRAADAYEIPIKDRGSYTARQSMASVLDIERQRIVYFGGISYATERIFNEIYVLNVEEGQGVLEKHEYGKDSIIPP